MLRSTVTVPVELDDGYVMAMWELADVRQVLALPAQCRTLHCAHRRRRCRAVEQLRFAYHPRLPQRRPRRFAVPCTRRLAETGALNAIADFVHTGGRFTQGLVQDRRTGRSAAGRHGQPDAPIQLWGRHPPTRAGLTSCSLNPQCGWSWLTSSPYILDDPTLVPGEIMEVTPNSATLRAAQSLPSSACPTAWARSSASSAIPLTRDPPRATAALYERAAHRARRATSTATRSRPGTRLRFGKFPAYESVPVSATLVVENL